MTKITGVFLKAGVMNHNGRIYTEETLINMVKQFRSLDNPMYGQIGYPEESVVNLNQASHKVNNISVKYHNLSKKKKKFMKKNGQYETWRSENCMLIGEIELLKTTQGRVAEKIVNNCVVRHMGTGNIREDGVVENFNLISFILINKEDDSFKGL